MIWPNNRCLRGMQQSAGLKINNCDRWFQNFPNNAYETAKFWCIVGLTIFIAKEKLHFFICSFYCCLVKEGWALKIAWQLATRGLVAYKLVAYKKDKHNCSGTQSFESQRERCPSNWMLLHHYQHSENQLSSYTRYSNTADVSVPSTKWPNTFFTTPTLKSLH